MPLPMPMPVPVPMSMPNDAGGDDDDDDDKGEGGQQAFHTASVLRAGLDRRIAQWQLLVSFVTARTKLELHSGPGGACSSQALACRPKAQSARMHLAVCHIDHNICFTKREISPPGDQASLNCQSQAASLVLHSKAIDARQLITLSMIESAYLCMYACWPAACALEYVNGRPSMAPIYHFIINTCWQPEKRATHEGNLLLLLSP